MCFDQDSFIKPWMVAASNDHYILDIARARQLLDWEPKHKLRDTLPKMVEALKRDPTGWYEENKLNPALVAWYGQRPKPTEKHSMAATAAPLRRSRPKSRPLPHPRTVRCLGITTTWR